MFVFGEPLQVGAHILFVLSCFVGDHADRMRPCIGQGATLRMAVVLSMWGTLSAELIPGVRFPVSPVSCLCYSSSSFIHVFCWLGSLLVVQ